MAMTMPPPRFSTPSNFMLDLRSGPSSAISAGPSNPAQLFQPYYLRPAYRFKSNIPRDDANNEGGPGRRLRKNVANVRRHIDYVATVLNHVENRLWQYSPRDRLAIQPDSLYQNSVLPPASTSDTPVDCILTRFVRAAMNKVKCPIYSICWTPEGKRLITGASTGEFTLWNGTAFNFETILQAHDTAIRALRWSHNDQWLVSADHDGFVKYWQPNMNNVHMYQAHKNEAIRCISFSPTDIKLATASDDGTARVWDFARCVEERILRGHGSDVRTVDWHPQKGLLVTGSRDSQQPVKLWDPKTGSCLATLHDHKNSVMAVQWNMNGNWLITGSRDHLIKLYDIRMMREVRTFRGHKKEVTSLAWHPIHEGLFVSGGGDGSLAYWLVNNEKEVGLLEHAHDQAVWTLEWHPLGSNDNNTKFWSRNKPGDTQEDIFGLASFSNPSVSSGILSSSTTAGTAATDKDATTTIVNTYKDDGGGESRNGGGAAAPIIPGMGLDADIYQDMKRDIVSGMSIIPGLGGGPLLYPEDLNSRHGINQQHQHHQQTTMMNSGAKRTLIKQPPPKRVQRQFERMWNVAKPSGGGMDDDEHHHQDYGITDSDPFHRSRTSLLGHHPPSSPPSSQQQPPPMNIMIDQQQAPSSMGTNPFDLSPSSSMQQQQHLPPMHMQQWPPMPPPPMIGQQQQQQPYLVPPPMLGPMWVQPPQLSHSHLDFDMDYRAAAAAADNPTPMPLSTVGALAPPSAIKTANEVIADSDRSAVGQSWRTTSITDHDLRLMQQQALLAAAGPSSTPQQPLYSADNATIQSTNNSRDPRQQQQQQRNNRPGGGDFFGNNPTSTTVDINEPYNANQVPLGSGIGSETMIGGGGGGMRDPRRRNNRDYPTKRK